MYYKNGRKAAEFDPVVGTLPDGSMAVGALYKIDEKGGMLAITVPGRVVSKTVTVADFFHAEDALKALRDAKLEKEAMEIFPDNPAPKVDHLGHAFAARRKFEEDDKLKKHNWISVRDRLPNDGDLVIAKHEGVYDHREVIFWRDSDGLPRFGGHFSKDGKGSQPATHWRPVPLSDHPRWKAINKTEIECHSMTECCGYAALKTNPYPVQWNPFNGVVQCHNCGHVYSPCAVPEENDKPAMAPPTP